MNDDENSITIDDIKRAGNSFNNRINNMSKGKQILLLLFLLSIFGALFYMSTVDKIETVEYSRRGVVMCTETYINGELNGSSCEEYYASNNIKWELNEQFKHLENLTLHLNQS